MRDTDGLPQGVVRPLIYPVAAADVRALERHRSVPYGLMRFWASIGSGCFNDDEGGGSIVRGAANRLLGPDEIVSVLDAGEIGDFDEGLPFFEMNDCIYLLVDDEGVVFANDTGARVEIAKSVGEFVGRLVQNPAFYISLLVED